MATLTLLLIIGSVIDLLIDMDYTENARTFPCHLFIASYDENSMGIEIEKYQEDQQ